MICFAALLYERISIKLGQNRQEAISMIIADVVYGIGVEA
tara:strand:+ start:823 stop:942 length:120 start_codon:yes stop_codon:yes gene_type:complete